MSVPSLGTILTDVLGSIAGILGAVATAISDNVEVIAAVIVTGALTYVVMRFGSRMLSSIGGWFKGLF
jgi:hypothetical protein